MNTLTLQPQRVEVRRVRWGRVAAAPDLAADLRRARALAAWLDTKFSVAGIRFGLEGVVGLIPVIGDLLGALAGLYPIWIVRRHRLGGWLAARMGMNLFIEWVGGLIPLVGDLFDVYYKANIRNVRLLEKAAYSRR